MSTTSWWKSQRRGTTRPRPSSVFLDAPGVRYSPSPTPEEPQGLPYRFDLNEATEGLTGATLSAVEIAGTAPSRIYETPVSAVDVGSRLLTGGRMQEGQVEGGFDLLGALGGARLPLGPSFGEMVGVADEALRRASNFMPAIINARDAQVWSAVSGLPDDTPITPDLLTERGVAPIGFLGPMPLSPEMREGFFGLGSRLATVGEFRDELRERGFFFDEQDGRELDPVDVGQQIRSGVRSQHSFGFAAINDNGLVDVAGRLALDPTNALFAVPGGAAMRLGAAGARLARAPSAERLIVEGLLRAPAQMRPSVVAGRILSGERTQATMRGLATALRVYKTVSYATAAGSFGGSRLTGLLGGEDEQSPLHFIHEFTTAVENRRPLSGNAAFMLTSAVAFPYGRLVRGAARTVRGATDRIVGRSDAAPFERAAGGRQKWLEAIGGPEGEAQMMDFLHRQYVRDELKWVSPADEVRLSNLPSGAARVEGEMALLDELVAKARRERNISPDAVYLRFQTWFEEQGGFVLKDDAGRVIRDAGVRQPFDFDLAMRRWRDDYIPAVDIAASTLFENRSAVIGLRSDIAFREQMSWADDLANAEAIDGMVPVQTIRAIINRYPNLNSTDFTGWWAKRASANEAVSLRSVRQKLRNQRRHAPTIEEFYRPFDLYEAKAPKDYVAPTLDDLPVDRDAVTAARLARHDRRAGLDPELTKAIDAGITDQPAPFLHPGLKKLSPEEQAHIADLERAVVAHNPSYKLKPPPEGVLALVSEHTIGGLRQYTALGQWLQETHPFSAFANFTHALTRKVTPAELTHDARLALGGELRKQNLNPRKLGSFMAGLQRAVELQPTATLGGLRAAWLRDIASLTPNQVNLVGLEVFGKQGFDYYRLLAHSSSRYNRTISGRAAKGAPVSAALKSLYDVWDKTDMSVRQRVLAKTYYPLFRFTMDPRWLLMNAMEANVLMTGKHGVGRGYRDPSQLTARSRSFLASQGTELSSTMMPDTGYSLRRQTSMLVAKAFDKRSFDDAVDVLAGIDSFFDDFAQANQAIAALRRATVADAEARLAGAKADLAAKRITQAEYETVARHARYDRALGTDSLAQQLADQMYRFETDGPAKTIDTEIARWASGDAEVLAPLFRELHIRNQKTWDDVQRLLHGNPDRSTLERLANSYWLLWPISYQIKATKWLADIMLNGSFGHNNGALLAGKYALWQEEHERVLKTNPAYAAMMAAQPSLWFTASMLFPMTPEDIGITLSRPARLLGTPFGLFSATSKMEDPLESMGWLAEVGPLYTKTLWDRILAESDDAPSLNSGPAPQIRLPAPPPAPSFP